ncbi:MAG TPA: hypothetical protein VF666_11380 [Pyrinomonadaceae bacterium]|jgi:hypothetical protein
MTSAIRKRLKQLTATSALLLFFVCSGWSQQSGSCKSRRISLERGESTVVLRGKLEPCKQRIYKLRARQGQRMSVVLLPDENDVVFWVRGRPSLRESVSLVLDGIHRNGVTDWSGELPFSGEYEIYVSRPPVSDRREKRVLPYKIELRIE